MSIASGQLQTSGMKSITNSLAKRRGLVGLNFRLPLCRQR
jgi:hypothetical protein